MVRCVTPSSGSGRGLIDTNGRRLRDMSATVSGVDSSAVEGPASRWGPASAPLEPDAVVAGRVRGGQERLQALLEEVTRGVARGEGGLNGREPLLGRFEEVAGGLQEVHRAKVLQQQLLGDPADACSSVCRGTRRCQRHAVGGVCTRAELWLWSGVLGAVRCRA